MTEVPCSSVISTLLNNGATMSFKSNTNFLKLNFPPNLTFAKCLNQLRKLEVSFLNLGNLIFCPEYRCLLFFKNKQLIDIHFLQS